MTKDTTDVVDVMISHDAVKVLIDQLAALKEGVAAGGIHVPQSTNNGERPNRPNGPL